MVIIYISVGNGTVWDKEAKAVLTMTWTWAGWRCVRSELVDDIRFHDLMKLAVVAEQYCNYNVRRATNGYTTRQLTDSANEEQKDSPQRRADLPSRRRSIQLIERYCCLDQGGTRVTTFAFSTDRITSLARTTTKYI